MQFLLCYPRISPTVNTLGDSSQPVRLVSRIDEALSPHARAVTQIAGIEWLRKVIGAFPCVQILLPTSQPVSASLNRRRYRRETHMKFKQKELLLGVLLGTGLRLLNDLRDRLPDNMDDIKDKARQRYRTASDRLGRASDVLRGKEESRIFGKVGVLLIGVGVGVGIGLLIAPASGDNTRADITDKVSDFADKVRERTGKKPQGATGTYGE